MTMLQSQIEKTLVDLENDKFKAEILKDFEKIDCSYFLSSR